MATKQENIGPCKLCGQVAELRLSHVIPEFVYKPLYDADHRFVTLTAEGTAKTGVMQKGHRERLLCQACETLLSKWEGHVAPVFQQLLNRVTGAAAGSTIVLPAQYLKTKLFFLSLLWRASIASDPNFVAIDLGSHEPTVRQMILDGLPGAVTEFPLIAVAHANVQHLIGVIGPAGCNAVSDISVCWLEFAGIRWTYFLSPRLETGGLPPLAVTHVGLTVLVGEREESEFLQEIAKLV